MVALLCALAQVWLGIDGSSHRHERCAEHGEMAHVEHAAATTAGPAERGPDPASGGRAVVRPGRVASGAHRDHAHCVALFSARVTAPLLLPPSPVEPAGTAPPPCAPALAADARGLYRLAPKASPPRLG